MKRKESSDTTFLMVKVLLINNQFETGSLGLSIIKTGQRCCVTKMTRKAKPFIQIIFVSPHKKLWCVMGIFLYSMVLKGSPSYLTI